MTTSQQARRAQLRDSIAALRGRVAAACRDAGRDPAELTVVAVTKFFPASDVRLLAQLGVTDMGENRDQEAGPKYADVRADTPGLRLHFIGQLQTNKARSVASYADVVQTVDRPKLARALDRAAHEAGRRLRVLVQVNLDQGGMPGADRPDGGHRGGVAPGDAPALADLVEGCPALRLCGVMGVAPVNGDADGAFARLAQVAAGIRATHPEATWMSAGMSGDLEAAVRHGATHLRVGTAILGSRPPLR